MVNSELLTKIGECASAKEYGKLWELLNTEGRRTEPAFGYSGLVVAVAISFLGDQGVKIPMDATHKAIKQILDGGMSLTIACSSSHMTAILDHFRLRDQRQALFLRGALSSTRGWSGPLKSAAAQPQTVRPT